MLRSMVPAPSIAWVFYLGAAVFGLVGALWLLRAIFWDRSRGRRRCPRCWYDMSALEKSLQCPECGREVVKERAFFRTRRRWRQAALACLVLFAAYALWCVPAVRARGWWSAAPRPVLALMIRLVEAPKSGGPFAVGELEKEIRARFFVKGMELRPLWPGERFLLSYGARAALRAGSSESAAVLAAELLVLTRHDAIDAAPEAGRARVILAASSLVYARCTSYRDTGSVKGTIGARDEQPFMTAFRRSGSFRFEFLGGHPFEKRFSMRYVVWGKEPAIHSWWTIPGGAVGPYTTIEASLSGPTGVSGGSASNVPMQLIGSRSWITRVKAPAVTKREVFDGHECYVIRAVDFIDLPVDFWIDASSLVLRKIHKHWEFPSTTVYRPELDVDIPDEVFTFDSTKPAETPLGDGEAAAKEFRPLAGDPNEGAVPVPPEKQRIRPK
jgi:hypothetical protein